jgi:hypothetical protein
MAFSLLLGIFSMVGGTAGAESWEIETVDSLEDVGESTSLALDSNDLPHISYYDVTNTALKYARWDGSVWQIMTVDSHGDVGRFTSIALDANDCAHISYYDATNRNLKYARWTGTQWNTEIVDSGGEVGTYSSIAVDDNFHVHISYYNGTVDLVTRVDALKYAHWDGFCWNIETIDYALDVGRFTDIALDDDNYPHISYINCTDNTLKYARWTGTEWDMSTITTANRQNEWAREYGSGTSLALDSSDSAHIVFVGGNLNYLKYARWEGGQWVIENVSDTRQVYLYVSIALDNNDFPHITYYTQYWNTINYARWNGTGWNVYYVDRTGGNVVGGFNSLALDSSGYAHVSYFDYTYDDLKYAKLIPSNGSLEPVVPNNSTYLFLPPIQITPIITPPASIITYTVVFVSMPDLQDDGSFTLRFADDFDTDGRDFDCPLIRDIDHDGRPSESTEPQEDEVDDVHYTIEQKEPPQETEVIIYTKNEIETDDTPEEVPEPVHKVTKVTTDAAAVEADVPVAVEVTYFQPTKECDETENPINEEQSISFSQAKESDASNKVSYSFLLITASVNLILLFILIIVEVTIFRRTTPKP